MEDGSPAAPAVPVVSPEDLVMPAHQQAPLNVLSAAAPNKRSTSVS